MRLSRRNRPPERGACQRRGLQSWLALLAVAFLGAGCLDASPGSAEGQTRPASGADVDSENPLVDWFGLDGCTNELAGLTYILPEAYGVQPLPGWQAGPSPAELQYFLFQCDRAATGPFEPGPVMALLELHTHREVPASCSEGDYTDTAVLNQLWLTDAEMARHLHATHGLPAKAATMSLEEVATDAGVDFRWTFAAGGPASDLTYRHLAANAYDQREYPTYRLFWANGRDSVSYIDLQMEVHTVGPEEPLVVEGTLRSPLLYAGPGPGRFIGYGSGGIDAYAHGEIHRFKDTQCSEPL